MIVIIINNYNLNDSMYDNGECVIVEFNDLVEFNDFNNKTIMQK